VCVVEEQRAWQEDWLCVAPFHILFCCKQTVSGIGVLCSAPHNTPLLYLVLATIVALGMPHEHQTVAPCRNMRVRCRSHHHVVYLSACNSHTRRARAVCMLCSTTLCFDAYSCPSAMFTPPTSRCRVHDVNTAHFAVSRARCTTLQVYRAVGVVACV
jgi:hypothetical protein